jgi:putative acetyltransferase
MKVLRTNSDNQDFKDLVTQLDHMLAIINGNDHDFYSKYNKLTSIKNVIILYDENEAIACGSIKNFDKSTCEIKRMFTIPSHRRQGLAGKVVDELELWAADLGYTCLVLETSVKLESAVQLYHKKGYIRTPNYGQYKDATDSICYIKFI